MCVRVCVFKCECERECVFERDHVFVCVMFPVPFCSASCGGRAFTHTEMFVLQVVNCGTV